MKKLALLLVCSATALMVIAPVSAQADRWWNERTFYELFVRSFYDSNGDGIGDLQGVIQKLDYLNDGDPTTTTDLGVTGIWLMPIFASPSYHGYDVTDYLTVNPDYGTNDDFKALIAAAHQRGIAVIVDLPINHTSSDHPWFIASAAGDPQYADWYRWQDTCPTYRGPWGEQVWIPRGGRCYYAVFWEGMPDLNYENPAVTAEMDDIARFWLEDMGADGFRLDGLQHIVEENQKQENTASTLAWAQAFDDYVHSVKPDALVVGEVYNNSYITSTYVPQAADLVFEFDLAQALVQSANQGNFAAARTLQNRVDGLYPPNQYAAFLTNHDQNRVGSELRGDMDKEKIGADLLLTQPGVPFIYYGEEIGMSGMKPDERLRTPMQWDATEHTGGFTSGRPWEVLQNDYQTVNIATQTVDPASVLSEYRNLIRLRGEHPALRDGDFVQVDSASRHVYSFLRRSADETLLVVLNLSNQALSDYPLSLDAGLSGGEGTIVFGAGDLAQPSLDANGGFADYLPVTELDPYDLLVIQFAN